MLTGLDDDASITRAYEAGATDFFVKSTQWSLLAGRLRHLLRSSSIRIELERSKAKLARAQDLARMGSFDWRRGHGGPVFSVEGLRVLGMGPDAAFGMRQMLRTVNDDVRGGLIELLHDALRHSLALATDVPVTLRDRKQRIVHVEAEPEFSEHGHLSGYTGIVQDVTDRRLDEDKIRHLANFDTLTGLPNRHQLILRAESALEHARRIGHQVGVLLIDLDRFKVINDTLGHAAGDELLMEVARRLRSSVRHTDKEIEISIDAMGSRSHRALEGVGRYGGDEFVALLPEISDELDAERVAIAHPGTDEGSDLRRRAGVLRHRERRHLAVPARWLVGGRPDAQRRCRDVRRQVAGQEHACALQPRPRRQGAREDRARERAAQGDRAQRTRAALPTEGRCAQRAHDRRRGADALEQEVACSCRPVTSSRWPKKRV